MAIDYATNPAVFNKRVILLKELKYQDNYGTPYNHWHPVCNVSASIEPLSGREYWLANQTSQGEESVRITIRYRKEITNRMRIRYESVEGPIIYEMTSPPINYQEKNEYLQLMCRRYSEESQNG